MTGLVWRFTRYRSPGGRVTNKYRCPRDARVCPDGELRSAFLVFPYGVVAQAGSFIMTHIVTTTSICGTTQAILLGLLTFAIAGVARSVTVTRLTSRKPSGGTGGFVTTSNIPV